ncbi:TIGR02710 family CRISPR-associated protein [Candidatus Poribacteria bacterium]|nr:TIGR02710 family CRISPR-associated protein [Candidatus Poribacteria bacterium]
MEDKLEETINEISKIAKGDDLKEIKNIIQNFDEAIASMKPESIEDRSIARALARDISKKAFSLEKKYVPEIPENKKIADSVNCDTMIMTVGFQKEPIILSITCMQPQRVILLHTDGSRPVALEVENDPAIKKRDIKITPLFITEYDASENYRVIKDEALPRASENTVIDPTGGRKVMVASLALVAFYLRHPMIYLHSIEKEGVVYPFTERLRFIENPFDYFGDAELSLVEEQFNSHLYEAAFKTCQQLGQRVRHPTAHTKITLLRDLIEVYCDWDGFLHSSVPEVKRPNPTLSEKLGKLIVDFCRLGFQNLLPDNIDANITFLKSLDETWIDKRNISNEFRLIDIYASALRRGSEEQKKYDDAVARLYRCLEMCSTIKLLQMGLKDTARPDYENLSSNIGIDVKKLGNSFRRRKHRKLPFERLGLDDQMTLLEIIGDKIASIYKSMRRHSKNADSLMEIRNRSILAHGTNPVTEDCWPKFRDKVEVIIKETIGEKRYQELINMAMHGDIHIV